MNPALNGRSALLNTVTQFDTHNRINAYFVLWTGADTCSLDSLEIITQSYMCTPTVNLMRIKDSDE